MRSKHIVWEANGQQIQNSPVLYIHPVKIFKYIQLFIQYVFVHVFSETKFLTVIKVFERLHLSHTSSKSTFLEFAHFVLW